jgi:hypothetical protein
MKKLMKSFVILAVIAIAFGTVGAVFAQDTDPEENAQGTTIGFGGLGIGSRSKRGGRGSGNMMLYQNRDSIDDGLLHDEMMAAFSLALEISVEELEARIADGETLADIALGTGMTIEDFRALLTEIRTTVHDQAVEEGLLPGAQSGWVNERRDGNTGYGARRGGAGQGLYGTGNCPYDESAE